ncbi:MAG: S-layer homology domain-containing protein [Peptococcaceae bacterium]|nr:S-layer homology domain-containing protein [Peptococcaceae bacterium]
MQKKFVSALLVGAMALSATPAWAADFDDVQPDAWYAGVVSEMVDAGLMVGVGDGQFAPTQTLTRETFVTILGRALGVDATHYADVSFGDVKAGAWYAPYVQWAASVGVTTGTADGTFGVGEAITREQMAVMMNRVLSQCEGLNLTQIERVEAFTDADQVSAYAVESVENMRLLGLMAGDENGAFHPQALATRAEAAAVMSRLVNALGTASLSLTADDTASIVLRSTAQTTPPTEIVLERDDDHFVALSEYLRAIPVTRVESEPATAGWTHLIQVTDSDGNYISARIGSDWIIIDGMHYYTTEGYFTPLINAIDK